jgi:uncharacterized protein involved in cysteine biosynthesis
MWKTFLLSVDQLRDRAVIGVLIKSLVITLILCAALGWAVAQGVERAFNWYNGDPLNDSYYVVLAGMAQVLTVLLIVVGGFRAIAIPVTGFFADEVVAAVEAKHFPGEAAQARKVGIGLSLRMGLMSLLRVVVINLFLLPVYLGLLLTAVGPIILFVIVNALLLGRDLGEMVAARHLDRAGMKQWLANSRWDRALLGLAVTGAFMVPLLNFIAPLIGAAMATHLFHKGRGAA